MTPMMWIILFAVAVIVILVLRAKGETRMGDFSNAGVPAQPTRTNSSKELEPSQRDRLIAALQKGNKIEAVRLYMEMSGNSNLDEATKALERLEKLVNLVGGASEEEITDEDADWDAIEEQLVAGNMVEAIRIYRDTTGSDLKEAKEAVESYHEANKHNF